MRKIKLKVINTFKEEEWYLMIKQLAWNTFKNTGDINTFMELSKVIDIEKNMKAEQYGNYKDKGDNNFGE